MCVIYRIILDQRRNRMRRRSPALKLGLILQVNERVPVVACHLADSVLKMDNARDAKMRGGGNSMMTGCRIVLVSALVAFGTQASAQSRQESHYEMVTTQQDQNISFGAETRRHQRYPGQHYRNYPTDKVVILDKRSGELWAWSESLQTVMYLGQIFPLAGAGPFARVIRVNPEEKGR